MMRQPPERNAIATPLALMLLLVGACTAAVDPWDAVALRTALSRTVAAPGDTVVIHAILSNPGDRPQQVGRSCGPPVLVEARVGTGAPIHPVPLDAVFICPGLDTDVIEPGETDTVSVPWRVPPGAGVYSIRSGFRGAAGLERLTAPVTLTVR